MKHIILARRSRRIFAGLIDLLILLFSSLVVFFTLVMPFTFDIDTYRSNGSEIAALYGNSGLFLTQEDGSYVGKSTLTNQIKNLDDVYDVNLTAWEKSFPHQNLSKDLYEFYTTKYGVYTLNNVNLSEDAYYSEILKLGSEESNIASFDKATYKFVLLDDNKANVTYEYFLDKYTSASVIVDSYSLINDIKNENTNMMFSTLILILPLLVGFGAIYELVIPLSNKNRRTMAKMMFKLDVIASDSYQLKPIKLLPRFLVYIFVEVILGFATFGGLFLITYTMFLFSKNRRALHDFAAKSVVIDAEQSVYFLNEEEEEYITSRSKNNA